MTFPNRSLITCLGACLLAAAVRFLPVVADRMQPKVGETRNHELFAAVTGSDKPQRRIIDSGQELQAGAPATNQSQPLPDPAEEQSRLLEAFVDASGISDPDDRLRRLTGLCCQWAEFDPPGAIDLAFEYGLENAPGLMESLAYQWAAKDFPAARGWVANQTDSEVRASMVTRLGFLWAQEDPIAAATYVVSEIAPGHSQTEAVLMVLHQWIRQDPESAREWTQTISPSDKDLHARVQAEFDYWN